MMTDAKPVVLPVQVAELRMLLERALNTLDPALTPDWALLLSDSLRAEDHVVLIVFPGT